MSSTARPVMSKERISKVCDELPESRNAVDCSPILIAFGWETVPGEEGPTIHSAGSPEK